MILEMTFSIGSKIHVIIKDNNYIKCFLNALKVQFLTVTYTYEILLNKKNTSVLNTTLPIYL